MSGSSPAFSREALSALLLDIRAGDQNAFSRLFAQYQPLIARLVSRFSTSFRSAEDADDFRQEAALALYQAALAYRIEQEEVTFGLFARVCMTNRLIDLCRAHDRYAKNEVSEAERVDTVGGLDPAAALLDAEAVAAINAKIDGALSPYERRVFGHYLAGRSARAIAGVLAADEKSVTNAIYRIRRKLKALL